MELYLDTADVTAVKRLARILPLHGVTTNPTLIHKSGRKFMEVVEEICGIVDGPVSGLHREHAVQEGGEPEPGVRVHQRFLRDALQLCQPVRQDGVEQGPPIGEIVVQRADADAGPAGHLVERYVDAAFGEKFGRGCDQPLPIAHRVHPHIAP